MLQRLIADGDALLGHAATVVDALPEKRFPAKYTQKARMRSWLAWQKRPGVPPGQAVSENVLTVSEERLGAFAAWLRLALIDGGSGRRAPRAEGIPARPGAPEPMCGATPRAGALLAADPGRPQQPHALPPRSRQPPARSPPPPPRHHLSPPQAPTSTLLGARHRHPRSRSPPPGRPRSAPRSRPESPRCRPRARSNPTKIFPGADLGRPGADRHPLATSTQRLRCHPMISRAPPPGPSVLPPAPPCFPRLPARRRPAPSLPPIGTRQPPHSTPVPPTSPSPPSGHPAGTTPHPPGAALRPLPAALAVLRAEALDKLERQDK